MLDLKETRKRLEKLDKKEVVDAFLYFLFEEESNKKVIKALEKTRDEAVQFLETHNLTESIDDKDDKVFDRGVKWFKELPALMKTIGEMKEVYLPQGMSKNIRSSNSNSVLNFIRDGYDS